MPLIAIITSAIAGGLFLVGSGIGIKGRVRDDVSMGAAGNYALGLSYTAMLITVIIVVIDRVFD